jgi:hypothetical protein
MMKVLLLFYVVMPMSAGVMEKMETQTTPSFTGVSFRFPTEQACQDMADIVNGWRSDPKVRFPSISDKGFYYSNQSKLLVANCEADDPKLNHGKKLTGWKGFGKPRPSLEIPEAVKADYPKVKVEGENADKFCSGNDSFEFVGIGDFVLTMKEKKELWEYGGSIGTGLNGSVMHREGKTEALHRTTIEMDWNAGYEDVQLIYLFKDKVWWPCDPAR